MSIADLSALWELYQWFSTTKVTAAHIMVPHTYFTWQLLSFFLSCSNIQAHTYSLWSTVTKINLHFRKLHIHAPHREVSHSFKGCNFSGPQVNIQIDRPKKLTWKTWLVKPKPSEWKYVRKRKKCRSVVCLCAGMCMCDLVPDVLIFTSEAVTALWEGAQLRGSCGKGGDNRFPVLARLSFGCNWAWVSWPRMTMGCLQDLWSTSEEKVLCM